MSKNTKTGKKLSPVEADDLIAILKDRFGKNPDRHKEIQWEKVEERLRKSSDKLWSLDQMEATGGEPDVVGFDKKSGEYIFVDCSAESPKGRRSVCYDTAALESRKEHKPANSALGLAAEMGVTILNEEQYRNLQKLGKFDTKTSSWIETPADIREKGGALFCDWRYGHVFTYHNGAESYYGARGFRGMLKF
ncbi:MAG: DUF4256 domain-containing protein [Acidobacteria bacterium]|nr:DUF4256 domain-containing protein [Acidobacteriota bacterium]